jgi:outer membrane protein assembly factor BamB
MPPPAAWGQGAVHPHAILEIEGAVSVPGSERRDAIIPTRRGPSPRCGGTPWPRGRQPRRRLGLRLVALGLGVGLLAGAGLPAAASAPRAWTTFLGSLSRNPVVPDGRGTPADLSVAWGFRVAPGRADSIVAAPSVVDGVAYFGAMDHMLYALNIRSGAVLWSFRADNQIMSQPLVVGGRVFFGTGNKRFVGGPALRMRGTGPSALYALSATNGHLLWIHPVRGEAMPTPAYQDGILYEATGGGEFYALDADSGRTAWVLDEGVVASMSSPAIADGIAVFGGRHHGAPSFYGVSLRTHRIAWRTPFSDSWAGTDDLSPTIVHGVVYVQVPLGHGPITVEEVALRLANGRQLWRRLLGTGPAEYHNGEETGVAAYADGTLYVGSPILHGLWALNADNGQVRWHADLPVAVRAAPAVTAHHVFAVSAGQLFALERTTGTVVGHLVVGHRPPESNAHYGLIPCASPAPTLVGRTLLVAGGAQDVLMAVPVARLLGRR